MKYKSISRRVYRAILTVSAISMAVMVLTVLLVNEDLERTMLEVEFAQERDLVLMNNPGTDTFVWETPSLSVVFVPTGEPAPATLPRVFHDLPGNHAAEIAIDGETYLVTVETVSTGLLYVAKNITHFEQREALFQTALIVMTLVIMAFSLLLAVLGGRRIVRPLQLLSERISRIPVGPSMPRMETDYADAELHAIAVSFNRFLDELESYVRREQSLLNLASHELRTPIAVMSGALDVLEQRDQLHPKDRATLQRMRQSCDEMRDNVNVLLKLARRESGDPMYETIDLRRATQQVIDDLKVSHQAGARVELIAPSPLVVTSDPVLVHMLLRNLVQNAVQHSSSNIRVTLSDDAIAIEDQGPGLTNDEQAVLLGQRDIAFDGSSVSGLGLYIVTLMTERLGWKLDITQSDRNGTRISLQPRSQHSGRIVRMASMRQHSRTPSV